MALFGLEHSPWAYRADFAVHGVRPFSGWHARHHHHTEQPACYGVTTAFRDHVFGSTGQPQRRDRDSGRRWRRA